MVAYKRPRPLRPSRNIRRVRRRMTKRMTRRVPRAISSFNNTIVRMKRKVFMYNFQPSTVATSNFWFQWTTLFNQMTNFGEIPALFDQYKICAIKVQLIPRFDSFAGNDTTDTTLPGITNQSGTYVHVCYDNRSVTTPSGTYSSGTLNTFLEQSQIKTYPGNKPITVYFKPTVLGAIGSSTTTTLTQQVFRSPPWIPSNANTIPHYGPQFFFADNALNGTFGNSYDVYQTFYIMARGAR